MPQNVTGDLNVQRSVNVARRVNTGLSTETITGLRNVTLIDYAYLVISNATTQDVILPDAATLTDGWEVVVMTNTTSVASVNVKTYHATVPVLLKNILVGRAYRFTLLDKAGGVGNAGTWALDFLEEADKVASQRFVDSFNATTDWTAGTGYWTRTVTAVTHGMGTSPTAKTRMGAGPYVDVMTDQLSCATNGDITIQVPDSPDLRFAGQMIIM